MKTIQNYKSEDELYDSSKTSLAGVHTAYADNICAWDCVSRCAVACVCVQAWVWMVWETRAVADVDPAVDAPVDTEDVNAEDAWTYACGGNNPFWLSPDKLTDIVGDVVVDVALRLALLYPLPLLMLVLVLLTT